MVVAGLATLAALLLAPTAAVPEGKIVIDCPGFSSHLRISVSNGNVLVNGQMTDNPEGCTITEGHRAAVCPIAGAAGSKSTWAEPATSSKCATRCRSRSPSTSATARTSSSATTSRTPATPKGSRRNRCIGDGGDDVCITGAQNSDCVGGAGNDYCRTSAGSDGCWGGPGDDVC